MGGELYEGTRQFGGLLLAVPPHHGCCCDGGVGDEHALELGRCTLEPWYLMSSLSLSRS